MSLSQVVPAESERQEDNTESLDLFEVLEDRYAYEGFNKFAFYCFWTFVMFQWMYSCYRYPNNPAVAAHKLRKGLILRRFNLNAKNSTIGASRQWKI